MWFYYKKPVILKWKAVNWLKVWYDLSSNQYNSREFIYDGLDKNILAMLNFINLNNKWEK